MRKFIAIAFAAVTMSTAAFADSVTLQCSLFPVTFAGSVGSTTVSCGAFNGALGTLTGATAVLLADYQFGTTASNDIKLTFALSAPAGVTWANAAPVIDVTGALSSNSTNPPIPLNIATTGGTATNARFASAFNVGVTSSVVLGGAATSSGAVSVIYTYTPASGNTPEPATTALLGSALVALGVLGRKRFVR